MWAGKLKEEKFANNYLELGPEYEKVVGLDIVRRTFDKPDD